ncbi:hypothetical protein HOC35_07245 [Candidatus Woesearchaeota archaeon]|jgi:protease I|nr:hypothetical protein [Candidatus Woesearchaeota archaeon]
MKVVIIIAQEGYQDHELDGVRKVFDKHNLEYDIASPTGEECIGKFGEKIKPDKPLNYVELSEYDGVVIIGGPGAPSLGYISEFNNIIQTAYDNDMVIAAICISPMLLAKFGLLSGKKATVFPDPEALKAFKDFKVHYLKEDVVIDENMITAVDEDASHKFAEEIVRVLRK